MKNGISIIIPVYNAELYFKDCIDSLNRQTIKEFEVILVDDGSTDSSPSICDTYQMQHENVTVVHQSKAGAIEARLKGLEYAKYDYILFVDADDYVENDMIETYLNAIDKYHADIIIAGYKCWYSDGRIRNQEYDIPEGLYSRNDIEEHIVPRLIWNFETNNLGIQPAMWHKVFKKGLVLEVFGKLRGSAFHFGEDRFVSWISILLCQNMAYIHKREYYWRLYKYIPSYIQDELYFEKLLEMYKALFQEIELMGYKEKLEKQLCFMYEDAVDLKRKLLYREDIKTNRRYLFPFNKVRVGAKIILYGCGVVGKDYYSQIMELNYCEIVAWVDQKFDEKKTEINRIESVDCIKQREFDYVVIGTVKEKLIVEIEHYLVELGISRDKIVKK